MRNKHIIADVIYEMKDMQIQKKYRGAVEEFVRRVLERYRDKIDSIILFGSVARGEAKEDSDIDVLIVTLTPHHLGNKFNSSFSSSSLTFFGTSDISSLSPYSTL